MKVTVEGLEEVIAKLDKVSQAEKPILEGIREAMETARDIVTASYLMGGEGNTDFSTNIERIENGYMLTASGADVGFLEFGAGVYVLKDEFAGEVEFPVYTGSYSEVHKGQFSMSGNSFWYYMGQRYEGIFPTRGMQEALDYLRANIDEICKRKIEEWIGN